MRLACSAVVLALSAVASTVSSQETDSLGPYGRTVQSWIALRVSPGREAYAMQRVRELDDGWRRWAMGSVIRTRGEGSPHPRTDRPARLTEGVMLRFEGDRDFPQAPAELFTRLRDARFLVECIPDVESVREQSADAQHGGEAHEHDHRTLPVLLEGGREEGPELPEDDRQREQQAGPQADHDRGRERLDRAEGRRLVEVVRERLVEPVEQPSMERVRDDEPCGEGADGDEQPRTQLAEVLDERGLLAVAKAPREHAHGATAWTTAAGTRPRSATAARPSRRGCR